MFLKLHDLLFLTCLILGTLICVSSNNWFTAWLGLEINLLSMTPLILNNLNYQLSEAAIKYFLTQALASIFMIVAATLLLSHMSMFSLDIKSNLMSLAIMIKAGMIPFHFWFPQIIKLLNWMQCLILFTWQKIAPLVLFSFLNSTLMFTAAFLSSFLGAIMGLNQNNLKLLMTFSSISHSGWMALSCLLKNNMLIIYFSIYCFISFSIISIFNSFKINKIKQIKSSIMNSLYSVCLILNMMSLAGMPPLLGFLAKISIILILVNSSMMLIFSILIISSLISLFFYARLIYSTLLMKNKVLNLTAKKHKSFSFFMYLSIIFNILVPFLS